MNVLFEGVPEGERNRLFSYAGRLKPKGFQRRFGDFGAEAKVTRRRHKPAAGQMQGTPAAYAAR